ncbi:MAG: hypothetical protein JWO33_2196 [Caulobacteraceae bacterium]|nr:hypothetical protein [Caulobacteraceae bacterium]
MRKGKARWVAAAALVATSAAATDLDTAKLDEARSLVAEAVLIEQYQRSGRITATYAEALRHDLRDGLVKLKKEQALAGPAQAALDALDRHDAVALAAIRDRLVAQERSLGRAG